jgi:hypothetical protein
VRENPPQPSGEGPSHGQLLFPELGEASRSPVQSDAVTASSAKVFTQVVAANFTYPSVDTSFHFIAVGPR